MPLLSLYYVVVGSLGSTTCWHLLDCQVFIRKQKQENWLKCFLNLVFSFTLNDYTSTQVNTEFMGFPGLKYGGAKQGRSQNFGSRGEHQTTFHKWIPLTFCTAMASPKFKLWRNIQLKCTHQRLLKIFKKFIKHLHKNLKNSPKFFQNEI